MMGMVKMCWLIHDDTTVVSGLLDFGDMVFAPLVQEIAIAVDIRRLPLPQLLAKIGAMAAGYDSVLPLEAEEDGHDL